MSHPRFLVAVLILASTSFACTRSNPEAPKAAQPPHLELEMTGEDYSRLLSEQPQLLDQTITRDDAAMLKPVLDLGKRNLDVLTNINAHRDEAHHISLTSKETENAFPVDQPREYNVGIVLQMYKDLLAQMPPAMKAVLTGTGALPTDPPLAEEDYRTWGRKTDVVYQIGTRWLLMKPYLDYYAERKRQDLRGYYYLVRETDLANELAAWTKLPAAKRTQLRSWIVGSCYNTDELADCEKGVDAAAAQPAGALLAFANKYIALSKAQWDAFFTMQWDRADIVWSKSEPAVMHIPFVDPNDSAVTSYLRDNIEDEWKWTGWNLRLDFQPGSEDSMTHLRFEAGVTPHVEVPGTIVMDKNQPTTEYDSRWTIRHEFGHILGFPDCYIEFYDSDKSAMVSYQLDITNLMCSRRGVFQQTHFDELKRVYFK